MNPHIKFVLVYGCGLSAGMCVGFSVWTSAAAFFFLGIYLAYKG